jgi:hypothetical protein
MGRIHPDAEFAYFSRHPECRDVVRPFLSCFDVTRGFTKAPSPDRLECFYLKAETFIAELIGLERELFAAYAPFPEFQARTIRLHDRIVQEDRIRLDPVGTILVSDDPETGAKVRAYLLSEPERPPIVALSRGELDALSSSDDVRRVFIEQLFRRDLFALESPLRTDTTFFGRTDTVSELLDRFRGGQNSGLFGLRRIGKTSVLYALGRRAETGGVAGHVYLDVSSPGVYQLRWWELLQRIIRELADPLNLVRGERSKIRGLTIDYDSKSAAGHFKADILSLTDRLPGQRVVLLLDEIEHITFDISPDPHWGEDFLPFWQTIRSVHQDTQGTFGFVVSGVNPHIIEADRVGSFDNPLFSTTKPFYLGPFDLATTREMVRRIGKYMGLRCQEPLYQRLFEEYGGHPFIVRQACSELAKHITERPGELTTALFEKHRAGIALMLERNVRQILNVLAIWYPEEYEMVRMLAHGERTTFREFAESSAEFTQHVEGYGLVREARSEPRISIGLVKNHLSRQPKKAAEAEPSDRESVLAEISRRRNRIEIAMRDLLSDGLRFAEGQKAMEAALSCLPADRRAVLAQHSYREIWPELYFNELASIMEKHFSSLQKRLSCSKNDALKWMDQINRCRADAHARGLSADDLAFLRVCFKRLEEILELS